MHQLCFPILYSKTSHPHCTKNEVSIKDFSSKCDQILRKLRIWSHLLKKPLMKNFIFCAVPYEYFSITFFRIPEILKQVYLGYST